MTNYLGSQPVIGNFVKLDAITVVNGQAAYTMQNGGVNFVDYSSVNQFMVSLNSVIQSPGSSFTVSSSTITFASNLVTGDVIDFIIIFGNSLSAGEPTDATVSTAKIVDANVTTAKLADDAVTAAKINNDIISGSTELASEPADTDEFLVSDAGTLKRIDYSLIKGGVDGWSSNSGNLLPADASKGIYLGVNSATASNLFDDFEFGTFTPAFSGSPSGSYTYQFGNYTKINKMVFFTIFLQGNFSGGSGSSMITGLPFTPSSGSDNVYYEPVTIGFTYGLGETIYQGFVQQNATELFLLKEPSGGARVHSTISSLVSSDMRISVSGFYNTAA